MPNFRISIRYLLLLFFTVRSLLGFSQASLSSVGSAVTESFTGYAGSSSLPSNWSASGSGTNGNTFNGTNQSGGTSGGWYGNNNMSFLGSGSASNGTATWVLKNNTGVALSGFDLSFDARMWKSGSNSPHVTVSYSISATTTPASFTAVPALEFSDATPSIASGTRLSSTISNINIPSGYYLFVRFIHAGGSSSDNLGWDEVSVSPLNCTLPADPAGSFTGTPAACGNYDISFSGTAPGSDLYYFQLSATGTSVANPATTPYTVTSNTTLYVRAYNAGCWSTGVVASQPYLYTPAPAFSTQPAGQTVTTGAAVSFSASFTNAASSQWQVYSGGAWINLASVAPYSISSTATSTTLQINPAASNLDGTQYRVKLSGCADVYSNVLSLNVNPPVCGGESFSNIPNSSSSYSSRTWVGDNSISWSATDARTDQTINGPAITIRDGEIKNTTPIANGIGNLSFLVKLPFTNNNPQHTFSVKVNNIVVKTMSVNELNGTTPVLVNINNINIPGNITVSVVTNNSALRLTVDDLQWSCYGGCASPITISSFLPTAGPAGTTIVVRGSGFSLLGSGNLANPSVVKVNNVAVTQAFVVNNTELYIRVAPASGSGNISIDQAGCTASSSGVFNFLTNEDCGNGAGSFTSDINITEIYDADLGNRHYIELFNGTGTPVDLGAGNYSLWVETGATNVHALSGTIPVNGVFVISMGNASTPCTGVTPNLSFPLVPGFNANDYIVLKKNGVILDLVNFPNYPGGANGNGFTQKRIDNLNNPTPVYVPAQWISTASNCNDLGVVPNRPGASPAAVVTAQPIDPAGCTSSFTVTTAADPAVTSIQWYFNNPSVADGWQPVSALNGTNGFIVAGGNSNTLTINGESTFGYQFFAQLTTGGSPACRVYSNAATNNNGGRRYRSVISGLLSNPATWQVYNDKTGSWQTPCFGPTNYNHDSIQIVNGHTVTVDRDIISNRIVIDNGGILKSTRNARLDIVEKYTGADFVINGTFEDNAGTTNNFNIITGATWQIGANGTLIKISGGSADYRDNYEGGIANIPATANWIYRYTGSNSDELFFAYGGGTHNIDMYYPNLTIENISGSPAGPIFNTGNLALSKMVFVQNGNITVVKGNLDIGGAGSAGFNVLNLGGSDFRVEGNTTIKAGSAFRNYDPATSATGQVFQLKGNLAIDGTLDYSGDVTNPSRLVFKGITPQTISGSGLFSSWTDSVYAGVVFNHTTTFNIYNRIAFAPMASLTINSGKIVLKSNAANTASIGAFAGFGTLTDNTATGGFIVERFMLTPRRWDLLAVPIQSPGTIRANWAEGQANGVTGVSGLGTMIFGPAGNLDFTAPSYSMKYWNGTDFNSVQNLDSTLQTSKGFFLYYRGDRNVNSLTASSSGNEMTVLRTAGKLIFGNPSIGVVPNQLSSVNNPYASRIDLRQLLYGGQLPNITAGINVYVWNPQLGGTYGAGAYETRTFNGSNFIATPANPNANFIESGQAFMLRIPQGSVSFPEQAKAENSSTWTRVAGQQRDLELNLSIINNGNAELTDAIAVDISTSFANAVDQEDALKANNFGENIFFIKGNDHISVERRKPFVGGDTIFIGMDRMRTGVYRWKINLDPVAHQAPAYLIDQYLHTETLLGETMDIDFTTNADVASRNSSRFIIVFRSIVDPIQTNAPNGFVIAPNPLSGRNLTVLANGVKPGRYEVKIYDQQGRNVSSALWNINAATSEFNVPLPKMAAGTYTLELNLRGEKTTIKFLVR